MPDAKPRLLFVEDDIGKRYVIARQLRAAGFEIDEAATGEEGLAMISPEHDVAILDIKLPDMYGWDVCRRIKTTPETADVKVLELSATLATAEDRARGLELGADCYLVHPVELVELVAALRALIRLRTAERDKKRALELFLGMLGHDLRSPLGTITTAIQVMGFSSSLSEQDRSTLATMDRTAGRMRRMIDELVVFAQSMTDSLPIVRESIQLAPLCHAVIENARYQTSRPIEIDVTYDGELSADPDRLTQVLDNLVVNAIRHGDGPVRVRAAREGAEVILVVHNGGPPIREEALPTLFDPFKRAGGREGGVGLGLYIVRQIVRAHGGSIHVTSSADAGTAFAIRLPLADPAPAT